MELLCSLMRKVRPKKGRTAAGTRANCVLGVGRPRRGAPVPPIVFTKSGNSNKPMLVDGRFSAVNYRDEPSGLSIFHLNTQSYY